MLFLLALYVGVLAKNSLKKQKQKQKLDCENPSLKTTDLAECLGRRLEYCS